MPGVHTPQSLLVNFPQLDLTGATVDTLKTEWNVDPFTGNMAIVFREPNVDPLQPDVIVGSILLEANRVRSMMEVLEEISRLYSPDLVPRVKQRTNWTGPTDQATTVFEP